LVTGINLCTVVSSCENLVHKREVNLHFTFIFYTTV